jgi:alkylation response protein AidB-like acyl-CoA dehydrogenase
MALFRAPLGDMQFVFSELWQDEDLADGECIECPDELSAPVLEQAARFMQRVLAPLSRSGDEEGCRLANGIVTTAPGYRAAFREYAQAGWLSMGFDPRFGGQGLPVALRTLVDEMTCAANLNFASYTNLIQSAYLLLKRNASEEQKEHYLPLLASGRWAATMCLTEAQAGSDLRLLRTKAVPRADGTYGITGQKVFISAGDHDLTENILHLVLARLPGTPDGTHGISLFLVPKLLADADGKLTVRNNVRCLSLEAKMGLRGSATCTMSFEDASGWMVGVARSGLETMFTMMNAARLGAAVQGLGIAQAAYQSAVDYARERRQGRSLMRMAHSDAGAEPIIVHPDVRRMLLTMRASVEGMRALAQWVARHLDISERHSDAEARSRADAFVSLMTPVLKATFSELGSECANLGVQVLGGAGYVRDYGMEQLVRDVRVTQIYDGTNGIQALDLVMRKVGRDRLAGLFLDPVRQFLKSLTDGETEASLRQFAAAFAILEKSTADMEHLRSSNIERCAAAATDYLHLFGVVALGFMWARMALLASRQMKKSDNRLYAAKLATARFYLHRLPSTAAGFADAIRLADTTLAFDHTRF